MGKPFQNFLPEDEENFDENSEKKKEEGEENEDDWDLKEDEEW